jgi:hypothetical protein
MVDVAKVLDRYTMAWGFIVPFSKVRTDDCLPTICDSRAKLMGDYEASTKLSAFIVQLPECEDIGMRLCSYTAKICRIRWGRGCNLQMKRLLCNSNIAQIDSSASGNSHRPDYIA